MVKKIVRKLGPEDSFVEKIKKWIKTAKNDSLGFLYNMLSDEMESRKLFDPDSDIHTETWNNFLLKASNDDLGEFYESLETQMVKRSILTVTSEKIVDEKDEKKKK